MTATLAVAAVLAATPATNIAAVAATPTSTSAASTSAASTNAASTNAEIFPGVVTQPVNSAVVEPLNTLGLEPDSSAAPALLPLDVVELDRLVAELRTTMFVPGVVVYLSTPHDVFVVNQGTSRYGHGPNIGLDDHFRIGSNTTSVTSTAILQLVDERRLELDDAVGRYIDGVPNGENITVRQLLEMRSGLLNYTLDPGLNREMDADPGHVWITDNLLDIAYAQPALFAPGAAFDYSNTNYLLLGLIIEKLEAKSLGDVFQDRFFGPLGMAETSFPDALDASLPDPHPLGYMFGTNTSTMETAKLTEAELAEIAARTLTPNNYTNVNPSWAWAAGAAISTTNDMVTWAQALAGGALLSPELQAERMLSPKPRAEPPVPGNAQYGLGIARFGQM
ncbi:MAG: class beta-lactamase-related serine hydrolase, partial [Glaciihabitans sp.]|nr:class beta-lactamase-related serine hydrolase [Glaciihabitans sp.]